MNQRNPHLLPPTIPARPRPPMPHQRGPVGPPRYAAPAGLGPAPFGPPMQASPDTVRPGLWWIVLSWVLFAVLAAAAVVAPLAEAARVDAASGPTEYFGPLDLYEMPFDPAQERYIFAAVEGGEGTVRCGPYGRSAADLTVESVAQPDMWAVSRDGRTWEAAFRLLPGRAGTYQFVCDGPPGTRFGIGTRADSTALGVLTVGLGALAVLGFGTAVVASIVVPLRRRAARERLLAVWSGGPARNW